jgi:peptide/nickel transport system substrate-binding protein
VTRNPNYWKSGRAHFDEVETLAISDLTARTIALKTKKVDQINRCDAKTFHLLEKDPEIEAIKTEGMKHYSMPMRTDKKPFNDNNVRMALKLAIDREQLVKTVLKGYGTPGNDHPITPIHRYFASELPQRKYDPDKAKYYLKKAGCENHKFKIHPSDTAFEGAIDTAVLFREHAAKAGIQIEVVREPADGYWSNVWMKKDWSFCYWNGRPTEDWSFSLVYASNAAWNDSFWKNERFDQLLIAARSELDEAKRREMYVEMQQIVRDDGGAIIPMFAKDLQAASKKLRHGKIAANYEMDGMRASERWWFA